MYFTAAASSELIILFQQWRATSTQAVTGSFVAVLALAVLYECMTGLHVHLRSHLSHQEREKTLTTKKSDFENIKYKSNVSIQFSKTCLFVSELSFAYFLMLVAMTYNTWLFVAVVIGRGLGYYLVTPLIGSRIDSDEIDHHGYSDLWQDYPHPVDI
ncbi:probable low affinity copper uptake protein 2 isoform X2 [Orbicella faveolata]|nr:probable low affinity copper uptake protein 2 isoform X2 [Orbicella faveolata]XP_020626942.1 probable low affinity copper uptake protein 2 isoform X2 [Orbicella faveolata]